MSQLAATIEVLEPRKPQWDLWKIFWMFVGILLLIKMSRWVLGI